MISMNLAIFHGLALTVFTAFSAFAQSADAPAPVPDGPVISWAGSVSLAEWDAYAEKFVSDEGRVIDTLNGGISHSEGQGYGLLLAFMAGDEADFARIWSFTDREMRVRDDGLLAWKWGPGDRPRVTDVNNATDGDLLVAYALEGAAQEWGSQEYAEAAAEVRDAIKARMVEKRGGLTLIVPGAEGFRTDDGLVINPSYWVQEALTHFAETDPSGPWADLRESGRQIPALWARHQPGSSPLPEWALLPPRGEGMGPAGQEHLGAGYGYNALRAPLYAVRDGMKGDRGVIAMAERTVATDGSLLLTKPDGSEAERLTDNGYAALASLIRCAILKEPEGAIGAFVPTEYYPSTIHLLTLSAARLKAPECVIESN